jgi:hypothetical protein
VRQKGVVLSTDAGGYSIDEKTSHFLGHYDLDVLGPTVEWIREAVRRPIVTRF